MSDEKLARQWAERKRKQVQRHLEDAGYFPREDTMAAIEHILATTTPPTMADVEWDHDKYHLHGATTPKGDEVVMLWHDDIDTDHIITDHAEWQRDRLTPNGKRYELREVGAPAEPAHSETLETLEDYENAPAGTVVAEPGRPALTKTHGGEWHRYGGWFTSDEMAGTERQVLRWGKHEDTSEPTVSLDENVGPDQPEHPETLVTEQDYESAPEGTVVAEPNRYAWSKEYGGEWRQGGGWRTSHEMADTVRRVLRWGWGK